MKTAGVSGCRIGWMLITFDSGEELYKILPENESIAEACEEFDRIFIDLPIGLEDENPDRECDLLMKQIVGEKYAGEVLIPPVRPALYAPSYAEANMTHFDYTEREIALETWHQVPKIQTVDTLLRNEPQARKILLESHPEHLFQILNDGIIFQKSNLKRGIRHRLDLIKAKEPVADDFFRNIKEDYRRNDVPETVIVNTMVLALFAKKSAGGLKTIPEKPPVDAEGLTQAYHFA